MYRMRIALAAAFLIWSCTGSTFAQGTWEPTDFLTGARHSHSATLLPNGKVLVAGGWSTRSLTTCELYDPATGFWESTGDLAARRFAHTATLLASGVVVVVGGRDQFAERILSAVEGYDSAAGRWIGLASTLKARERHTATLLPSGRLLVVGGRSSPSGVYEASAEIYDPASNTWTPTGSLATARHKHTATLLPSGKVLVAGGENASGILASAELYDPSTGIWEAAGSFTSARFRHSATLLPSGLLLFVGGVGAVQDTRVTTLASAELYDSATGAWTATSPLATARYRHAANLLPSGQVLITGGEPDGFPNKGLPIGNAELYDPASGTWASGGNLVTPRYRHTATLLPSGQVLIAGGRSQDDASSSFPDTELFDPIVGAWSNTASTARSRFTLTLLPTGEALAVGGWNSSGFLAGAELYDPTTGRWQSTGSLQTAREEHSATLLLSGKVLVVGGFNNGVYLASAELYDPLTRTWEATGSLLAARERHTATLLPSGKVLVAGGYDGGYLADAELYDPDTGTWERVGSLNYARHRHRATLLNSGQVLVTGGRNSETAFSSSEIYDPVTRTWQLAGSLNVPRHSHTATLLPSGKVLVAGGEHGSSLSSAELYDPELGTWRISGEMAVDRQNFAATLLVTGKVLVTGGLSDGGNIASAEIYDPATGRWSSAGSLPSTKASHASILLRSGDVLIAGGSSDAAASTVIYQATTPSIRRAPVITSASAIRHGETFQVEGYFRSDSEASGNNFQSSASGYPLLRLRSLDGRNHKWLVPDPRANLWEEPASLTVSDFPSSLDPGNYLLTAITNGVSSEPVPVLVECSLNIRQQPLDQTAMLGYEATFSVEAQGARRIQWQKDEFDIPGANASTYTTPPVTAADAGTTYRAVVDSLCMQASSNNASLILADSEPPMLEVASPNGGEYWPLSSGGSGHRELITWVASDNIRVCEVEVALLYSNNGGANWNEAPAGGGLPAHFGQAGPCAYPGVTASSQTYMLPPIPPSGQVGSLYKIRVRAVDQAGNPGVASSLQPFFMVEPNPDSVRTLILHNLPRMALQQGIDEGESEDIAAALRDLANHPRVQGHLVDLAIVSELAEPYEEWDIDPASPNKANAIVTALRDYLRLEVLPVYTGVNSIVVVGDDRIVPMARLVDATRTPESTYTSETTGSLTTLSTVGKALSQNYYLSDDLLGIRSAIMLPITTEAFAGGQFIPTLAVGRLVETPAEIIQTIATYISKDGVLDLESDLNPAASHKVLVTGYDFLMDSATLVSNSWKQSLNATAAPPLAPVDGQLISADWESGTVSQRRSLLRTHLSGNGGANYGINSLNGHATHFEEGVPGASPTDIQGLPASEIYGPHACGAAPAIDLPGAVVYSVGCHGGLPVPGSCINDADHSLDLPQTMMARGVVGYLANSGYGWGIKYGIGVSERLIQIFSEELMSGGTVNLGEAVVRSKQRYFLEQPGFDVYDQKTLLQWTYFGLPMYSVRTGIVASPVASLWRRQREKESSGLEKLGPVTVERRVVDGTLSALPDNLLEVSFTFDLSGPGVYRKYDSLGNALPSAAGCSDNNGCYYTLLGLVERGSGTPDLPIQPYLVYESQIPGTSQHGGLWLGGDYHEESGWRPVIAELVTNHGDYSSHGSAPRLIRRRPTSEWIEIGEPNTACRPSDLEINSLVMVAGEALKVNDSDPTYSRQRLFQNMDIEAFYFNDQGLGGNCDRHGPVLGPGFGASYHQVAGTRIDWAVAASDIAGVWRVVVVYDMGPDSSGNGRWESIELAGDGEGVWRGSLVAASAPRVTYMIQAVDRRGNVEWVNFVVSELPASGVVPSLPMPFDVSFASTAADLAVQVTESPDPVAAGGYLGYTVAVSNLGPEVANEVRVAIFLPQSAVFAAHGGSGWDCEGETGMISCRLATLGVGVAPLLSIFVVAPPIAGPLTNRVSVSALETDPQADNNTAIATATVVGNADLAVTLTADQEMAIPGRAFSYSIVATNNGPHGVVGATLTATLPPELIGVSWTCTASAGASSDTSGVGNLESRVNLSPWSSVNCQVIGVLIARATGLLESVGQVGSPAVVDAHQGNNVAATSTLVFQALLVFEDGFESGDVSAWNRNFGVGDHE